MGSQNVLYFMQKNAKNVIDISGRSNSEYMTITVSYPPAGNSFNAERVTISTAKTWSEHHISSQTNIGVSITYRSGKLEFETMESGYASHVSIVFG